MLNGLVDNNNLSRFIPDGQLPKRLFAKKLIFFYFAKAASSLSVTESFHYTLFLKY